jgi:hypothetical protein
MTVRVGEVIFECHLCNGKIRGARNVNEQLLITHHFSRITPNTSPFLLFVFRVRLDE